MSTAPLLVVFPRGQLTPKDKERMTKAGIVAVEAENPEAVVQLQLTAPLVTSGINGDAFIRAALDAMTSDSHWDSAHVITGQGIVASRFVRNIAKAVLNAKPKEAPNG